MAQVRRNHCFTLAGLDTIQRDQTSVYIYPVDKFGSAFNDDLVSTLPTSAQLHGRDAKSYILTAP